MDQTITKNKFLFNCGVGSVYVFGTSLLVSKALQNISMCLILFFFLMMLLQKEREILRGDRWLNGMFLSFYFGAAVWDLLTPGRLMSVGDDLMNRTRVLLLYPLMTFLDSSQRIYRFAIALGVSLLISSANGVIQFIWMLSNHIPSYRISPFNFYMYYSHSVDMVILFILSLLLYSAKGRSYSVGIVLVITSIAVLILSGTRGAEIGFFFGFLILLFMGKGVKKRLIWFLVWCLVGAVAVLGISSIHKKSFIFGMTSNRYLGQDESSTIRYKLWRTTLEVYKEHPIFGVGSGNLSPYSASIIEQSDCYTPLEKEILVGYHGETHNQYLCFIAERGVFGWYMILFWILYIPIRFLMIYRKVYIRDKKDFALLIGAFSSLVCFYFGALTQNVWNSQQPGFVIVSVMAVLSLIIEKYAKER